MVEKVTERTTYTSMIEYLDELGFEGVQEVESESKFPDILFFYDDEKFVIEVKIGDQEDMLDGIGQAHDYSQRSGIDNILNLCSHYWRCGESGQFERTSRECL